MLLISFSVHVYRVIHDDIYFFFFFSSGDLVKWMHRKVVCEGLWLFTRLGLLDFYHKSANISDTGFLSSPRRSDTRRALRLISFAAKLKQVHEWDFPQGNQICEVDPNEPPPLLLHPFLQMPDMFICLIPNYGSTSIACLLSLLMKRLEILKK